MCAVDNPQEIMDAFDIYKLDRLMQMKFEDRMCGIDYIDMIKASDFADDQYIQYGIDKWNRFFLTFKYDNSKVFTLFPKHGGYVFGGNNQCLIGSTGKTIHIKNTQDDFLNAS